MNTNDSVVDKLKYIGLDMDNIPDSIKNFQNLDYKPSKESYERTYKIYKYININDIQILLTPTNRLCDIVEKYQKAVPLYEYLTQDKPENIEKNSKFLLMLSKLNIDRIEETELEQEGLNTDIPFKIKYPKDYLWQIYYSEYTNKYFMLVTTEDLDYSAFFYILKKQLKDTEREEKIFVPICNMDYSGKYLNTTQISDVENYLWLFTKEWPLIYEVYDKCNNLALEITGKTYIYDDIQSDYKITLKTEEDAIKFYKLLKALFIIKTRIPNDSDIKLAINNRGSLEFYLDDKKVIYEILTSLIKEKYLKAEEKKINIGEDKSRKEKELNNLQKKAVKLEKEYLNQEKQISTFLECKKTFMGKIKYFFKYKKVNLAKRRESKEKEQEIKIIRLNKYEEVKSNYTLEELVKLYEQIDKEEIILKNLKLDINAIKKRITNLENKVKNAEQYIKEIDEHKKSIFAFWKFTNKNRSPELSEGHTQGKEEQLLKRSFNYEFDIENFSRELDKMQRDTLTKEELESIYLTTTHIIEDINKVLAGEKITEERLENIKENFIPKKLLLEKEKFDIFKGITTDNKLKILANKSHRESEREISKVLDINRSMTVDEYTEYVKKIINNLKSAYNKVKVPSTISIYKADIEEVLKDGFNVFEIQAKRAIKELLEGNVDVLNLYKIDLKQNTPIIAFTNIIYFENDNKTLPLGMNVSENILLDNGLINLELKSEKEFKIVTYKKLKNQLSNVIIKTVKVREYTLK